MIRAIAIDDELPALRVIENFCDKIDFIRLEKTFVKPSEGLRFTKKFPVDLVFLDINMPALSGLDFYKQIKQNTMAIFTTAHSEYAVEGFNLSAVDYLLKPFTFERFQQAAQKAKAHYTLAHHNENTEPSSLFIRADYSLIKVDIGDILYIEALDDYLKIHLQHKKMVVARMTMKGILEKLPSKEFIRVHRSYIVPFSRIAQVRNKTIFLKEAEIPIGTNYEEPFFKLFRP